MLDWLGEPTIQSACSPRTVNSERLIGISDAFSAFVYDYPKSCPHAHCTPNKSVPTLHYTHRPGPVYTGHACRHLPSVVPWISKDRLLQWSLVSSGETVTITVDSVSSGKTVTITVDLVSSGETQSQSQWI